MCFRSPDLEVMVGRSARFPSALCANALAVSALSRGRGSAGPGRATVSGRRVYAHLACPNDDWAATEALRVNRPVPSHLSESAIWSSSLVDLTLIKGDTHDDLERDMSCRFATDG